MKLKYELTEKTLLLFATSLCLEERSESTVKKYSSDLKEFQIWLNGRRLTHELVILWKEELIKSDYLPITVNSKLSALNKFLLYIGRPDWRVRYLKIQRKIFRNQDRELTKSEYEKLILAAKNSGRDRLMILLETICSSGIRVSEVKYITVEAAKKGRAEVSLKGKNRTILLTAKLCRKLLCYAKNKGILQGEIFRTRNGKGLSRQQIWAEMKSLCSIAGVKETKVFPHNLRHLFARVFYKICGDIVKLADLLGHSSIETTRIYLIASGSEHMKELEKMKLLI